MLTQPHTDAWKALRGALDPTRDAPTVQALDPTRDAEAVDPTPTIPAMDPTRMLAAVDPTPFAPNLVTLTEIGRDLLFALGRDPDTDKGIADTPARFARMWAEFVTRGTSADEMTAFAHETANDQMVVVSRMRVWSMCEHHLLPFWCDIAIGYVPQARILGLSKFARIAHQIAGSLQVQERLVSSIADRIAAVTGSKDVAVIGHGEHLCMTMRGVKTPALMTSSALRGVFYTNPAARAEFLSLSCPTR